MVENCFNSFTMAANKYLYLVWRGNFGLFGIVSWMNVDISMKIIFYDELYLYIVLYIFLINIFLLETRIIIVGILQGYIVYLNIKITYLTTSRRDIHNYITYYMLAWIYKSLLYEYI